MRPRARTSTRELDRGVRFGAAPARRGAARPRRHGRGGPRGRDHDPQPGAVPPVHPRGAAGHGRARAGRRCCAPSRSSATSTPGWRRRPRSSCTTRACTNVTRMDYLAPFFNELGLRPQRRAAAGHRDPAPGHLDPDAHVRAQPDQLALPVAGDQQLRHRRHQHARLRLAGPGDGAGLLREGHRPAHEPQLLPPRRGGRRPARRLARRRAGPVRGHPPAHGRVRQPAHRPAHPAEPPAGGRARSTPRRPSAWA